MDYDENEMARYRLEHPEENGIPDDIVAGTFIFQSTVNGYRIEELSWPLKRWMGRKLDRMNQKVADARDAALRRYFRG